MSTVTLSKLASINTPAANKGRLYYDSARGAFCWVDEAGAQWWVGEQRVRLTADLSGKVDTALADVTGLGFALKATTRYAFEFGLIWRSTDTTTGIKVGLTIPASPAVFTARAEISSVAADGTAAMLTGGITTSGDSVLNLGQEAANTDYLVIVKGRIVTGAAAGQLQLQWAAEVGAAGTVTPKQGSDGRLWLT